MATASRRPLHIVLWILQVALGLMMLMSGSMKLFTPIPDLVEKGMKFASEYGELFPRFLGVCLIAGGLGLILPAATRILPVLTPIAAAMLSLYFALAVGYHVQHSEPVGLTVGFTLIFAFIAFGRFKLAPIAPKSA